MTDRTPTLLFVDDEPPVLHGIERLLRRQREWRVVIAVGGAAGIAALDSEDPDVLVTDMQMPGVDGMAVLAHAARTRPRTVRAVLSGNSALPQFLASLRLAHQYVLKPCGGPHLVELLRSMTALAELLQGTGLLASIPARPRSYHTLIEGIEQGDSLASIGRALERDLAVSALLLRAANSAFIGNPCSVASVARAVQVLGSRLVHDIVLCATATASLGLPHPERERFERHAMDVSMVARALFPDAPPGLATAAMLHEIGSLLLADNRSGEGPHPDDVGGYLLGMWHLPLGIVDAVANRSRAGRTGKFGLPERLHVADAITHAVRGESRAHPLDPQVLALVPDADVDAWMTTADRVLSLVAE